MFRSIALAVLVLTSCSAAGAQDWTGFYAGVIGGLDVTHSSMSYPIDKPFNGISFSANAGVLAGADVQVENVLLGLSFTASPLSTAPIMQTCGDTNLIPNFECALSVTPYATLQGRIGMPIANLLVYGTAGPALVRTRAFITATTGAPVVEMDYDELHFGYVAGIGVEAPVSDRIRIRGEYLFTSTLPFDAGAARVIPMASQFRVAGLLNF